MTVLSHISEKPWSDYSSSDYTLQQWHDACLIHEHDGAYSSKDQCKLPVKTPDGAVNRNGVHAAAAALAGARGGVQASPDEMAKARKKLIKLYGQLNEDPPASLTHGHLVEEFVISHYGVKGMHWGIRNNRRTKKEMRVVAKRQKLVANRRTLSDGDLKKFIERLNEEKKLKTLVNEDLNPGKTVAKRILSDSGQKVARTVIAGAALYAVKVAVDKKFDPKEAASYLAPRPKK